MSTSERPTVESGSTQGRQNGPTVDQDFFLDLPLEVHRASNQFCVTPGRLINLSNAFLARYQKRDNPEDLHKAAALLDDVSSPRYSDPQKAWIPLLSLARGFLSGFQDTQQQRWLRAAVVFFRIATARIPKEHPKRFDSLLSLADSLMEEYELDGKQEDLDAAIRTGQLAMEAADELDDPEASAKARCILGRFLHRQGEVSGNLSVLEQASELCEMALTLLPDNHPDCRIALTNLGLCMHRRSQRTGNLDLLKEALAVQKQALDVHPPGHPLRGGALCNLGLSLNHQFSQTGDLASLEDAIGYLKQAMDCCLPIHKPLIVANLAHSLHYRYQHISDRNALVEAISYNRTAAGMLREEHPTRRWVMINLVHCLIHQHTADNEYSSAKVLFTASEEALNLHPIGHPNRDMALNNHAIALLMLHDQTKDSAQLDSSILCFEEALNLRPAGHPRRAATLVSLAGALGKRFTQTQDPKYLDQAAKHTLRAVELFPPGHPELGKAHLLSAVYLLTPDIPFYNPPDALKHIEYVLNDLSTSAHLRLKGLGIMFADFRLDFLNAIRSDPETSDLLMRLYKQAVALLPQAAYFGLDPSSRLSELEGNEVFGATAALYALSTEQHRLAIELIEEARGVFWSQALRLRSPLEGLPADVKSELTELFQTLERAPASSINDQPAWSNDKLVARRRVSSRAEELLNEIRATPGMDRFLLSPPFEALAATASRGPVVVFIAHNALCEAVVIPDTSGMIKRITLPEVTIQRLQTLGRRSRYAGMRYGEGQVEQIPDNEEPNERAVKKSIPGGHSEEIKVLENLWFTILKPIVEALNAQSLKGRDRPRIHFCPTGPFAFLPIHAAGTTSPSSWCSDYFVPSYTPTLTSLVSARRDYPCLSLAEANILLVAEPDAPNLPRIDKVIQEVRSVAQLCTSTETSTGRLIVLEGENGAICADMLAQLPNTSVLHLACHGQQDTDDPLDSGFCLRDGRLTVADLMHLRLSQPVLAFLSACETAKGDARHPDQAVHLAAAMLFVGFRSVIATMWGMGDMDGPFVAKTVYEELWKNGALEADNVPFALDAAVAKLRRRGVPPARWAPFIHIGA